MLPVHTQKTTITNLRSEIETKNHRKKRDEKPAKNGTFLHFCAKEIEMESEECRRERYRTEAM